MTLVHFIDELKRLRYLFRVAKELFPEAFRVPVLRSVSNAEVSVSMTTEYNSKEPFPSSICFGVDAKNFHFRPFVSEGATSLLCLVVQAYAVIPAEAPLVGVTYLTA